MGKTDKALERTIKPWDYKESVEVAKHYYESLQKSHLDLVRELHAAHNALSNSGYRRDLTSGQMSQGSKT